MKIALSRLGTLAVAEVNDPSLAWLNPAEIDYGVSSASTIKPVEPDTNHPDNPDDSQSDGAHHSNTGVTPRNTERNAVRTRYLLPRTDDSHIPVGGVLLVAGVLIGGGAICMLKQKHAHTDAA